MKKTCILLFLALSSCVSTKSTLKNVDENAPDLVLIKGQDAFLITEISTDNKYGFDPDYPINLFYRNTKDEDLNPKRFFNALTGPNGEKVFYKKVDTCCPFPTKHTEMGAGYLDLYEVRWVGIKKVLRIYVNIYSKGHLKAPAGFGLKKFQTPKY